MTRLLYRVTYLRSEWSRADAWDHLRAQQIPGCPSTELFDDEGNGVAWRHGWEKDHGADEWAWSYWGPSIPERPSRNAGRVLGVGAPSAAWDRFLDEQLLEARVSHSWAEFEDAARDASRALNESLLLRSKP